MSRRKTLITFSNKVTKAISSNKTRQDLSEEPTASSLSSGSKRNSNQLKANNNVEIIIEEEFNDNLRSNKQYKKDNKSQYMNDNTNKY
ncbi:hypothetical protein RclHR1_12080001 [Rhizophagus clarus]|uniref:Uncharacterized protein n=1 Tax=Rhizophagus clarus TaxID=94130 RepID=A0A2Z6QLB4_9GLOM|nr:hypothetical protein RclHR1_12080001 [Rhizophagus clarus]